MNILIHDPWVSVSDYVVAVIAASMAVRVLKSPTKDPTLQRGWGLVFIALALAAFLGGTDHGFLRYPEGTAHEVVWSLTLITLAITGVGQVIVAARLALAPSATRVVALVAGIAALIYAGLVAAGLRQFTFVIIFYLPGTLLLLAALIAVKRRHPQAIVWPGIVGLLGTVLASVIQLLFTNYSLGPIPISAVYHLIAIVALFFLVRTALWLVEHWPLAGSTTTDAT